MLYTNVWVLSVGAAVLLAAFITLLSVLLIFNCGDCFGSGNEYELLIGPDKAKQKAVTLNHLQQAENAQAVKEDMVNDVFYYLRSVPNSRILSDYQLWGIAWRGNRGNFLIELGEEARIHLLTLTKIKPEPFSLLPWSRKGSQLFSNIFQKLQHPYIQQATKAEFLIDSNSAVVATIFSNEGSLRDRIYDRCEPTLNWTRKYKLTNARALKLSEYTKFGRQILEGLLFLKQLGVPYTHLHCGNVIIRSDVARLTQIENGLLSLERQNDRHFKQLEKKNIAFYNRSDLDVVSFGIVLYEMAFGCAFNLSLIDELPENANQELVAILRSIFIENVGVNPPTIIDLCNHSFFDTLAGYKRAEVVPLDKTLQLMLGSKATGSPNTAGGSSNNDSFSRSNSGFMRKKVVVEEPVTKGWQPGPNSVITTAPRLMNARTVVTSAPTTTTTSTTTTQSPNQNMTYVTSNTQPQQQPKPQPVQQQPKPQPVQQQQQPKPQPVQQQPQQQKQEEKEQPATDNKHLMAIQGGFKLKKTVTNDRSAPKL